MLFQLAAKMVRLSPDLRRQVIIRETIKQLYCPSLGTSYVSLSADASTAMGKSPIFLVHDELGQVHGPFHPLYDAMETATSAHERPLSIVISTQAPSDADLDAATDADPRTALALCDFQNKREVMGMAAEAARRVRRYRRHRRTSANAVAASTAAPETP